MDSHSLWFILPNLGYLQFLQSIERDEPSEVTHYFWFKQQLTEVTLHAEYSSNSSCMVFIQWIINIVFFKKKKSLISSLHMVSYHMQLLDINMYFAKNEETSSIRGVFPIHDNTPFKVLFDKLNSFNFQSPFFFLKISVKHVGSSFCFLNIFMF